MLTTVLAFVRRRSPGAFAMQSVTRRALQILGGMGLVLCGAAVLAAWVARGPVERARIHAFQEVDYSLERIEARLNNASVIATDAGRLVEQMQLDLGAKPSDDEMQRMADRLQRTEQVAKLSSSLRKAESLMEASDDVAAYIQQTLATGGKVGLTAGSDLIAGVRKGLGQLTIEFRQGANDAESLAPPTDDQPVPAAAETRVTQTALGKNLLQRLARINVEISPTREQLTQCRDELALVGVGAGRLTLWAVVVGTVLALWMAVGQLALALGRPANDE